MIIYISQDCSGGSQNICKSPSSFLAIILIINIHYCSTPWLFLGEDTGIDSLGPDHTAILMQDLELQSGAGLHSLPPGQNVLAVDEDLPGDVSAAEEAKLPSPILPI